MYRHMENYEGLRIEGIASIKDEKGKIVSYLTYKMEVLSYVKV